MSNSPCHQFRDSFIKRGVKGGEDAADALLPELRSYLQTVISEPIGVTILVRAFANVVGLCATRDRDGKLRDAGQLRAFAAGFSRRQALFDFVDVGAGKERADLKVEGKSMFQLSRSVPPFKNHAPIQSPSNLCRDYRRECQVFSE